MEIDFIGGYNKLRSLAADGQDCMNLYPEITDNTGEKTKMRLMPTPGTKLFIDFLEHDTEAPVADFKWRGTDSGADWNTDPIDTYNITVDFKDYSTGNIIGRTWYILNRSSVQYEAFAAEEMPVENIINYGADYYTIDGSYYVYQICLVATNNFGTDNEVKDLKILIPT